MVRGRGDRGHQRGRPWRGGETGEVRLIASIDQVDRVIDRTMHHRKVQDRHRRRLAGARGLSTGGIDQGFGRVAIPIQHHILQRPFIRVPRRAPDRCQAEAEQGPRSASALA